MIKNAERLGHYQLVNCLMERVEQLTEQRMILIKIAEQRNVIGKDKEETTVLVASLQIDCFSLRKEIMKRLREAKKNNGNRD